MSQTKKVVHLGGNRYQIIEQDSPENGSGMMPVGHKVLILPDQIETETKSGIVIVTEAQRSREEMAQITGVVVAVGGEAWHDRKMPWALVGQRVIIAKYSGLIYGADISADGRTYRLINDLDVCAVVHQMKPQTKASVAAPPPGSSIATQN